jgi:ribonuclease P protein component
VLPAAARLTRGEDFRLVTRRGRKAGRATMVVYALVRREVVQTTSAQPVVGFVVSKAVGNSVVRHRVTRRLRHVMRDRLGTLPEHSSLVIRALPAASAASSAVLRADLDAALRRLRLSGTDDGGAE